MPDCPDEYCGSTFDSDTVNGWLAETTFQPLNSPFAPYSETVSPVVPGTTEFWDPESDIAPGGAEEIYKMYRGAEVSQVSLSGCYNADGIMDDGTADGSKTSNCISTCFLQIKAKSQSDAVNSIFKTIFMMFVLVGFSLLLTHDANVLVVGPLERMMSMVKKLAKNPLGALTNDVDDDDGEEETKEEKAAKKFSKKDQSAQATHPH